METVLVSVLYLLVMLVTSEADREQVLSRPKRYVVFPEGSEFSMAFCMSFKTLTDDDIYTGGMNLAVAYELPNETLPLRGRHEVATEPPEVKHRRDRRDLFRKMEIVFNSVGVDGRACMLRALCEASQRFVPRTSLVSEILRIIFTMPLERVKRYEPEEHHQYDEAHRRGLLEQNCTHMFPKCTLSLVDMALRF